MKKIISMLLALVMMMSTATVVFAEDTEEKEETQYEKVDRLLFSDAEYFAANPDAVVEDVTDKQVAAYIRMCRMDHLQLIQYSDILGMLCGTFTYWLDVDFKNTLLNDMKSGKNIDMWRLIGPINSSYFVITNYDFFNKYHLGHFKISFGDDMEGLRDFRNEVNKLDVLEKVYLCAKAYYVMSKQCQTIGIQWLCGDGSEADPDIKYDVNLDGEFGSKDIRYAKEFVVGTKTKINLDAADRDGDDEVTSKDVRSLKMLLVG